MMGGWKGVGPGWLAILLLCSAASTVCAAEGVRTETQPVVVVELFTSEGCSSCPPADALLRQIDGTRTTAGQFIIGISEHVTYWNRLGWSDPYSSEVYTERQERYRDRFGLESAYTPQIVVNGSQQSGGSDRAALERAFEQEARRPQISLQIVSTSLDGNELAIGFRASGLTPGRKLDVMAVLADHADSSRVLRGENSGRTLDHAAVARSLVRVAVLGGDLEKTVKVPVPAEMLRAEGRGHHLVLFAQSSGLKAIVGADTKPF